MRLNFTLLHLSNKPPSLISSITAALSLPSCFFLLSLLPYHFKYRKSVLFSPVRFPFFSTVYSFPFFTCLFQNRSHFLPYMFPCYFLHSSAPYFKAFQTMELYIVCLYIINIQHLSCVCRFQE